MKMELHMLGHNKNKSIPDVPSSVALSFIFPKPCITPPNFYNDLMPNSLPSFFPKSLNNSSAFCRNTCHKENLLPSPSILYPTAYLCLPVLSAKWATGSTE